MTQDPRDWVRRREVLDELDDLSLKIDAAARELRTQASVIEPKQGDEKLRALAFMRNVYAENAQIPVWPVDWRTIRLFSAAQVLPILSLIGTSAPVVGIVAALLKAATR